MTWRPDWPCKKCGDPIGSITVLWCDPCYWEQRKEFLAYVRSLPMDVANAISKDEYEQLMREAQGD